MKKLLATIFFLFFLSSSLAWVKVGLNYLGVSKIERATDGSMLATGDTGLNYVSGIYKADSQGSGWIIALDTESLGFNYVDSLAVDSSSNSVYAGIGYGGKIYQSTDSGSTWTEVADLDIGYVKDLLVANDGTVYAGTDYGGIFKSPDNGLTWKNISDTNFGDMQIEYVSDLMESSDGTIYIAANHYGGGWDQQTYIFKTTNQGDLWTSLGSLSCTGAAGNTIRSLAEGSDGALYAASDCGIFKSTDDGSGWKTNEDIEDSAYINEIIIDTNDKMYAATNNGLYTSSQVSDYSMDTWNQTVWNKVGTLDSNILSVYVDENLTIYAGLQGIKYSQVTTGGIYKRCEDITCYEDSDCDDADSLTTDTCIKAGQCNSECSYSESICQNTRSSCCTDDECYDYCEGMVSYFNGDCATVGSACIYYGAENCDDENDCTTDTCIAEIAGIGFTGCYHENVADDTACVGGTCQSGECITTTCDGTKDSCCSNTDCDDYCDTTYDASGAAFRDGICYEVGMPCIYGVESEWCAEEYPAEFFPCHEGYCSNGQCLAQKVADGTSCGEGTVCQNGNCVETSEECADGETLCNSVCVDTNTDTNNCGTCEISCTANQECNQGSCRCTEGYGDCNTITEDGCEADLNTNTDNCGDCGSTCAGFKCETGMCGITCTNNADCATGYTCEAEMCIEETGCAEEEILCDGVCVTPACTTDADCDDALDTTTDTCMSPTTCDAYCENEECTVACTTNADCDDEDELTTDSCENPATCNATCSYTSAGCQEGQIICVGQCRTPVCTSDTDCDDADSYTIDTCDNPGTCDAACTHTMCPVTCYINEECWDADDTTTDTCLNPGSCDAICQYQEAGECQTHEECDDKNPCTTDECQRTTKKCTHKRLSGCEISTTCAKAGTRYEIQGAASYCDLTNEWVVQKQDWQECQNNYECKSNLCLETQCRSITKETAPFVNLVKNITETVKNIIDSIIEIILVLIGA